MMVFWLAGFRIMQSINYGDARNIVEEFVAGMRRKLEKGEKVVFDNIGSFINNQEGNVQFEPDRNVKLSSRFLWSRIIPVFSSGRL